jgi:hypothetical protein
VLSQDETDQVFDIADLEDDDEPDPNIFDASQLHDTPLPQTQTEDVPDISTPEGLS